MFHTGNDPSPSSPPVVAGCLDSEHADAFDRSVHIILGLPFDAVTIPEVVRHIRIVASKEKKCFISTPNLNFLVTARTDPAFRQSVLDSDLSLADGMPIIWIARLLGIPLPERVPGSGLIECLRAASPDGSMPLKVFFFGGDPGAAQMACEKLKSEAGGLTCVGALDPGFGSAEDLSAATHRDAINATRPDFLVVSLGAKKGQAWIVANREKLNAAVISHLGAVVKFVAGDVPRAPILIQKLGLEWIWRIRQEPRLWQRYWNDGLAFLGLVATNILPLALWVWGNKLLGRTKPSPAIIEDKKLSGRRVIRFGPCLSDENIQPIREIFRHAVSTGMPVDLDFSNVHYVDSAFLAQLQIFRSKSQLGVFELRLINVSYQLRRAICWYYCIPNMD